MFLPMMILMLACLNATNTKGFFVVFIDFLNLISRPFRWVMIKFDCGKMDVFMDKGSWHAGVPVWSLMDIFCLVVLWLWLILMWKV